MTGFHGKGKRTAYFEGWYLRHQSQGETVAFIPAFHIDPKGQASASLQIITEDGPFHLDFPAHAFSAKRERFLVRVGNCVFSEEGCQLDVNQEHCALSGRLSYGPLTPLSKDIMGPFRFVPLMECRHSVFSLSHRVDGEITLNGKKTVFGNGIGYMEGDRGRSFPSRYLWTQCGWEKNCLMLSVAHIPFAGGGFTGCIGVVYVNGIQRRVATYLGAKIIQIGDETAVVKQGKLTLTAKLLQGQPHALRAPASGGMTRLIRESASCRVAYRCTIGKETLLDFVSDRASFEGNWGVPPASKA